MVTRIRTAAALLALPLALAAAPAPPPPGFALASVAVPFSPRILQPGDLDGDGDVDLLVLSTGHGGTHEAVLLNGPGASFAPGWQATGPASYDFSPPDLDLADLDADGDTDFVANVQFTVSHSRLNAGDATFDSAKPFNWVSPKVQHMLARLDADAYPDLVSVDIDLFGYVSSFENSGDGSFGYVNGMFIPNATQDTRAELGDVTGDGLNDAVRVSQSGLEVTPGKAAAGFPAWGPNKLVWGDAAVDLALADLSGDGRLDVVVSVPLSGAIEVFYQLPAGGLSGPAPFPGGVKPGLLTTGDMDSDGLLDVVVVNQVGGTISVLHNDGGGVFLTSSSYPGGRSLTDIVSADLDGDGDTDLAGTHQRGYVVLFFNQLVP